MEIVTIEILLDKFWADLGVVRGRLMQQRVTKRQVEKGARNPKFIERLGA